MVRDDLRGKPSQLKFVRVAQMLLFSNALCDPPLGQTTVLKSHQDTVGSSPSCLDLFSIAFPGQVYGPTGVQQVIARAELGSGAMA